MNGHIEEGHTNKKVFENIEAVARARANGTPSLRLQSTLHAGGENDLYDVIRYGARIGCDTVNVGRLDRKYAPDLKRPNEAEEKTAFEKADNLSRSLGIKLDWLQYSVSDGLTRFFYRLLRKKLHRSGRYCLKTFNYVYVTRAGDVTPCCLLPQSKMGNLLDGNLREIWQNGKFKDFRENYRQTCGACDLWTVEMLDK
jgi:MoaA/NifB/PqqE/SkfB family radical SAM enzyme